MARDTKEKFDHQIRLQIYNHFIQTGVAPKRVELTETLGISVTEIDAAFKRLAEGHALVLQNDTGEILMAEPFSAVPTPFQVEVARLVWRY